jgi:hypothetical protein
MKGAHANKAKVVLTSSLAAVVTESEPKDWYTSEDFADPNK